MQEPPDKNEFTIKSIKNQILNKISIEMKSWNSWMKIQIKTVRMKTKWFNHLKRDHILRKWKNDTNTIFTFTNKKILWFICVCQTMTDWDILLICSHFEQQLCHRSIY